ncbi:WhiB family transcriptional regulator [Rhodococcus sp. IC4_135]|uniref:WhiB family transcriptional regulator n=1 Tax=Rhodococcus sp. IC4_135 TaxID=2715537 RepID=UPI0014203F4D|nr:WhiB family transcriptional regulator [Rhodococcus sp. IC4_135]
MNKTSAIRDQPVLPPPSRSGIWDWQRRASCSGRDTLAFFDAADSEDASPERTANAKAICIPCPVIKPCLSYALSANEPFGV